MEFTAEMIAGFLGGEIKGDPQAKVWTISKIEEGKEGSLSFLSNPKYEQYIYESDASIVIVNRTFTPQQSVKATMIAVDDAYACFAKLLELYAANKPQKRGVSTLAFVSGTATVGEGAYIGEFACIGENCKLGNNVKIYPQAYVGDNVRIGDNVTIFSGAKIYEECVIGNNAVIHSGAVIGADGFGFAPDGNGVYSKIPQLGNVVIEENVEIGANTCVDRATMGSTVIKKGVKLDNLIQIAHNVSVGENTVMASQVGVAGSAKIGRNCMFGGQVGVAGHISIADRVQVASQSGIPNNVKSEGEVLMGSPAYAASSYQRAAIVFKSLPDMRTKLSQLEREIENLKKILDK